MYWLGKIAGFSVQKVTGTVADCALSLVQSEATRYSSVKDNFECLKRTVKCIKAILSDAEERRYINDEAVNLWLKELKRVQLDADILLDEYETASQIYEGTSSIPHPSRKRKWYHFELPSMNSEWGPAKKRRYALEINKINKRLDEIADRRKTLRLRGEDGIRREMPQMVRPEIISQFDEIKQRVEEIARDQQTMMMGYNYNDLIRQGLPHSTAHILYSSSWSSDQMTVIGRQKEINDIVDLLVSDFGRSDNSRSIPVVPIHGPPGIGKTVVAKMVFNDKRICVYFDFKAWVTLTDVCDMTSAFKEIYRKITGQRCDFRDADLLQKLREHLKTCQENKFLLVIDNLCAEDFYYWWTLQMPLLAGGSGSKVLITTRNEKISQAISTVFRPSLTGLDEQGCWQIIQSVALPQGIVSLEDERLVPIGKEVAKRCDGFPMAAANLGELLNGKGEAVWSDVLCEMQALKNERNVVLASLRLRYHHLPYHLKQCFDHCSIFPQGYRFEKDQLSRQWIARGLITASNGYQAEAIGMSYFDDLVSRSFFEKFPTCDKSRSESYILPSLMYDLVRLNAEQEPTGFNRGLVLQEPKNDPTKYPSSFLVKDNLSVQSDLKQFPAIQKPLNPLLASSSNILPEHFFNSDLREEVSRLRAPYTEFNCDLLPELAAVQTERVSASPQHFLPNLTILDLSRCDLEDVPNSVGNLMHLRYLDALHRNVNIPESLCYLSPNLTILDLSKCYLEDVPDSVGNLMHLRYLDVSHNKIKNIPESLCNLFKLQTLSMKDCSELMELPKGIGRLTNLQHLDLHLDWEEITDSTNIVIPQGISELSKLQTFSRFNVNPINDRGCNLIELKDLNLRGDLCILNLEKTTTPDDAMKANLLGKRFIEKLMLRWDSLAHTDHLQPQRSEEVIDFLQPNNSLRCLSIINYPGTKYPDWMGYASFSRLETVRISNCENFNFLQLVGQLPWLKNLQIDNVRAKTMNTLVGFPSLEHLSILNMPFLERIFLENELPTLKRFYVSDCPNLIKLTFHVSMHTKIEIANCPSLSAGICDPLVKELPRSSDSEWQGVNQNSTYSRVVESTMSERRDVSSSNEFTEEEIEAVGESIKKWLRKGRWSVTEADNGEEEEERASKRKKTIEILEKKFLQIVAEESCFNFSE